MCKSLFRNESQNEGGMKREREFNGELTLHSITEKPSRESSLGKVEAHKNATKYLGRRGVSSVRHRIMTDPVVWNKVVGYCYQNWVALVVEHEEADAAMASMEAAAAAGDAATSSFPTSNTKPKYSLAAAGEAASASKACWQQQNYHVERNQCA